MAALHWTLSLLSALAWPVVTLLIALIFRRDLTLALGRMGRLKFRDLDVTFQQDLHQAEDLARKLPPPPPPPLQAKAKDSIVLELSPGQDQPFVRQLSTSDAHLKDRQALLNLAEHAPRKAVETAWSRVAGALSRGDRRPLPETEAKLVGLLQTLRDRASKLDRDPPSIDEARRFVELASPLVLRIESRG
jgi:hypothetical protein